jgi:large subunit ribosomal protein L29
MAKKEQTKTKAEDLKGKSPDELKAMLLDLRKQQMNMRFQRAGGQLENTAEIRKVRRTIARVKTFLGEKSTGTSAA